MNDTDITCTLYVSGNQEYLDVPLHVLRCIPLSEEAKKHIIGMTHFSNMDMVLGKHAFIEEIKKWNGVHHQLKIREYRVDKDNMLDHIYYQSERCSCRFDQLTHPFEIGDKPLTFPQFVSYRLVQDRENQTITRRSWSGDTLILNVEYNNGGSITLGIEPDGYCHS